MNQQEIENQVPKQVHSYTLPDQLNTEPKSEEMNEMATPLNYGDEEDSPFEQSPFEDAPEQDDSSGQR